jgi:anhydro-N-acetylmuramic acid kinase
MSKLFIGLMSGTSLDGIDTAIVDFSHAKPQLLGHHCYELSTDLRLAILELRQPGFNEINRAAGLDNQLGNEFANAVNLLLQKENINKSHIIAIGSHGQTIRHQPHASYPFTLQIGDPNIIAAKTGITTVADFRRKDIALGGQGAPLVPAFHAALFATTEINRIIVNIGGIANATLLPKDGFKPILGFDTGPGNTLLDTWALQHLQQPYDKNGDWASTGKIDEEWLSLLLKDPFFKLPPPKSTGQEFFNLTWLKNTMPSTISPADVQTTLVDLTARSILEAINHHFDKGEILICGGGIHNHYLISRIRTLAKHYTVDSTEKFGIPPDWMEAMAFAWLAKQTLEKNSGNIPSATGALQASVLGGVYYS